MDLFTKTSFLTSKAVTREYSTSFYLSTNLLEEDIKDAIFSVYGFVRFADEIVDTFHDFDKLSLLDKFESDMKDAIQQKISLNPILQSFQYTVNKFKISFNLIDSFMQSMKLDLSKQKYESKEETESYIYGSANVVGLMCLKIFTNNDKSLYEELENPAMMLGSAFQKVNFLRDLKADFEGLERSYFSNTDLKNFDENSKSRIIDEINAEFAEAKKGIRRLPGRSRFAVLTAYYYYLHLLKKIKSTPASSVMEMRVRISNFMKILLLIKAMFMYKFKLI